jgi:UDP-glucose 4-epimerase
MKVAITGGSGFVGAVVRELAASLSWEVTLLARASSALTLRENETRSEWDASQCQGKVPSLKGQDALINLAALIPSDYRQAALADACMQVNALAVLSLVEACERDGVGRLVHVSSGNIYSPSLELVTEDAATYPAQRATYYLTSKLAGELYVEHARLQKKVSSAVLRASSVYGPGMGPGLIPTFASKLLGNQDIVVQDGGRYGVDLVFVKDVANAVVSATQGDAEGIFNIGLGRMTTVLEVAQLLLDITGAATRLLTVQPAGASQVSQGFPGLDTSRSIEMLGTVATELRDGLSVYVRSLQGKST